MRLHIAIAVTALLVVGVSSKYETGRGIMDWLSVDSYPEVQPGHVPARSAVEPVGEILQEEGRRRADKKTKDIQVVSVNPSKGPGQGAAIGHAPGIAHGPGTSLGAGAGLGAGGIGKGPGTGIGKPVITLPAAGVLPAVAPLPLPAPTLPVSGSKPVAGTSTSQPTWGWGWITDLMKGPSWGWGANPGAGSGVLPAGLPGLPSLPALPSLPSLPGIKPSVAGGPGTGIGNKPAGSLFGTQGAGLGAGPGASATAGAGAGAGNNGIVSVTYGKPPPDHYDTHGPGIFNPFAGWLYPKGSGSGAGPGSGLGPGSASAIAGPSQGLDSPTTSEVLVVRYPEFIKTIGKGISQMTNAVKNLGQGFTNTLTKGINDASAGIGSGVYSIIPLEDVGNQYQNKGNPYFPNKGNGAGPLGAVAGAGAGGPTSSVYVDKHPSVAAPSSWFPSPSSWFGNYGSAHIDPDTTSTVYVDKGTPVHHQHRRRR